MEAFALIFVIAMFISLLIPEKKQKSKSSGDKLMDGILAVAKDIKKEISGSEGGKDKNKSNQGWGPPWSIILLTIVIGLLVTYLL